MLATETAAMRRVFKNCMMNMKRRLVGVLVTLEGCLTVRNLSCFYI
jgi:hypothetical protein